jgi:hypothetical protein
LWLKKINLKKLELSLHLLHYLQSDYFFLVFGDNIHERINRAAVMALPKPLQTFFLQSIFITQESTVPDLRRNVINDKGTTMSLF